MLDMLNETMQQDILAGQQGCEFLTDQIRSGHNREEYRGDLRGRECAGLASIAWCREGQVAMSHCLPWLPMLPRAARKARAVWASLQGKSAGQEAPQLPIVLPAYQYSFLGSFKCVFVHLLCHPCPQSLTHSLDHPPTKSPTLPRIQS